MIPPFPPYENEQAFRKQETMDVRKPLLISIEGNIGSGKSTMLKKLRELEPDWTFVDEPVDNWLTIRNDAGESLLEVFYKDIKRWSYTFQNAAVLSRSMMVRDAIVNWNKGNKKSRVIVMERCVETDRHVFAQMLHEDKAIDKIEWTLYKNWYTLVKEMIPKMDAFIWIDTDAEVASERIKKRGREGEDEISLEYLKKLDAVHREWLEKPESEGAIIYRSQNIEEIREFLHRFAGEE